MVNFDHDNFIKCSFGDHECKNGRVPALISNGVELWYMHFPNFNDVSTGSEIIL